jgi:hypothetical protein
MAALTRAAFLKTALMAIVAGVSCPAVMAQESPRPVYRCPGPPVLYTDAITPAEAKARNCRTIESAPITVVQGNRRPNQAAAPAPTPAASARPADSRVSAVEQRARDSDRKRVLEAELQREEAALAELKREFNQGEPERRGDERNYAKYQERVAEMRAAIARKEEDLSAIRREIAKLPPS